MLEKITVFENHEIIVISKKAVLLFIGFLLSLTLILILFFLTTDFDYILGRKDLAMKVGQTQITMIELKLIQKVSGLKARRMAETAFAVDFFATVLLAEAGRNKGLDQHPEFLRKTRNFADAIKGNKDEDNVAKASYFLEELAAAARADYIDNHNYDFELAALKKTVVPVNERLHLRTILVKDSQQAQQVMEQRLSGTGFAELNASWSRSLYKSVGGDIGWKSADNFPENIFSGLQQLDVGVLAEAFSDNDGTHLFEVINRPVINIAAAEKAARAQALQELKRRRLQKYLATLRTETEYWVNPILQNRCQIVNQLPEPNIKSRN